MTKACVCHKTVGNIANTVAHVQVKTVTSSTFSLLLLLFSQRAVLSQLLDQSGTRVLVLFVCENLHDCLQPEPNRKLWKGWLKTVQDIVWDASWTWYHWL
jgi:hypothetical protein